MISGMDSYGIPDHIFGTVDDAFYAAVGRVTMLAALLEERLFDLLSAFHLDSIDTVGGQPGTKLADEIAKLLPLLPTAAKNESYSLRGEVAALLHDAKVVLGKRHDIVHSIFANPSVQDAHGWRTLPTRKRPTPDQTIRWVSPDQSSFRDICSETVRLIDSIGRLLPQVEFEKMRQHSQQQ